METIQELSDRLQGLISSITKDDLDNKDFIAHKYMLVSLHAHTECYKIETEETTNSQKIITNKQYNLYKSIEKLLQKKSHESTAKEMYDKILECQNLVSISKNT